MIINSQTKLKIEQDFKVEAGPGAGKTEFLVNHIKNVIQTSERLERMRKIACITYTNTAVETVLQRLGKSVSNRVDVSTIHSFLYRNVVKPYCSFLPKEYEVCIRKLNGHNDPVVINKYVREWLNNGNFKGLKHPNTKNQLSNMPTLNKALQNWLLSMKSSYKNNEIQFVCDNTKAKASDKKNGNMIGINKANLNILEKELLSYKKTYWKNGIIDHEDILFLSHVLIRDYPFILTVLSAKYPYFFIDEFQDTSQVQAFIIDEIRKRDCTVGIIGDKAQAIYGFQGAQVTLFEKFQVEPINSHTIIENHRSSYQIVTFLNSIRKDINQESCNDIEDIDVSILIGDRNKTYTEAANSCNNELLTSLSRDNITSNAMKMKLEGKDFDRKLIDKFEQIDSNSLRRNTIVPLIKAIELSKNTKYKDAIKIIDRIFKDKNNPKKLALYTLSKMMSCYEQYSNGTLMDFYNLVCSNLEIKLSGFNNGQIKDFYENTLYNNMAICVNIIEDTSNHITIHKAKGAEFKNVFVIGNQDTINLLLQPDLTNNEEQRIFYVAMSRAKKKLFIQFDNLDIEYEESLKKLYNINITRITELESL
ncbi:DNA helicase II [Virgibacillus dokdonensis]|uniref:DNA 3'-5' helicase n=1 Tax=Virgibacillus dokdonensis TaxID=302167 RepID=A0A3E0WJ24_9BACI|nr:ATP-dependent helicase [Virgibacillus dokdonensis]RFA31966.1 DNA helicase II [Virgibacillus dokdonensis]